jgi:uncharacterized protein (DUF849 family)
MSEPTNQDLKELLLAFEKKVDLSLSDMNRRMEVGFAELNRKIDVGLAEVRTEIAEVRGEIKRVEEKVDGVAKRLDNQEFISRGAIVTFLGAILAAVTKYIFFSDRLP